MNTLASWAVVDEEGRLIIPSELAARYGLAVGARARIEFDENSFRLHRPVTNLNKIYVEPTNRCNIVCRTCIRRSWQVELGSMSDSTFERICTSLRALDNQPTVFFGGLGEPLFHADIVEMIARVKELGARAELITNGTLLSEKMSRRLIRAGLDVLWVSIDGARPESYADVRLGAALPDVVRNLAQFKAARPPSHRPKPEIGIAFVAMRRNVADLPEVLSLGRRLGAKRFMVSNLLPYSEEMRDETLYEGTLNDITYLSSLWLPHLSLPRFTLDDTTRDPFFQALASGYNVTLSGYNLGGANDVCTFIEEGSLSISWDGSVAPCLPLLHDHQYFLGKWRRQSKRHLIGNVNEKELMAIWRDPGYAAYRDRVQRFAFPPCTACGGCDLLDTNEEDCFSNEFPVCGGCLWAQGVIQCP